MRTNLLGQLLVAMILVAIIHIAPARAEGRPQISIADVTRSEGNTGNPVMNFTVRLSYASVEPVTFDIFTVAASAYYTVDFKATTVNAAVIPAGQTRYTFSVPLVTDTTPEGEEFFWVYVVNASGADISDGQAKGTIVDDDDEGEPTISIEDLEILEGDYAYESIAHVKVKLSHPYSLYVSFTFYVTPESAEADLDYFGGPASSVFRPGETEVDMWVHIVGDARPENDETARIAVRDVSNAKLGRIEGTLTILNDDGPADLTPRDDFYSLAKGGQLKIPASVGVLANDGSRSGRSLSVSLVEGQLPKYGSVTLDAGGSFDYRSDGSHVVGDVFAYRACAGDECAIARVHLAMQNRLSEGDQYVWYFPSVDSARQGFVRIINQGGDSDSVSIWGIDAEGRRSEGTVRTILGPGQALQFNSEDAAFGNSGKGLEGALGLGKGDWTLVVRSGLDLLVLAYVRTPDGFVTPVHDRVFGDGVDWHVPVFNPSSNPSQQSVLRIINTTLAAVDVRVSGMDDQGQAAQGQVEFTLAPWASKELSSSDLEYGNMEKGLTGALGDGSGKWQLDVSATGHVAVQSLLRDPSGYLTNLSAFSSLAYIDRVWLFPSGSRPGQQGFLRLTNKTGFNGQVVITGVDDAGRASTGNVTVHLGAMQSVQLNASDLEIGSTDKPTSGVLGRGTGDWRLSLTGDVMFTAMVMMRTDQGFLTSLQGIADESSGGLHHIPTFNPGSNRNQTSFLRVINPGSTRCEVSVNAKDDAGNDAPGGAVSFAVEPGEAKVFSAWQLEAGAPEQGLAGALGVGNGKWRLAVVANADIRVQGLLEDPAGHLINLSRSTTDGETALIEPSVLRNPRLK